ncbi:MAG: hypothetical protein ACLQHK_14070 [Gallionellaceae bacterium]
MATIENDHETTTKRAKMESSLLLGQTASWWDAAMLISLAVVAFVAFLVAGATTGSVVANKRESAAAKVELERYKLGVASQVAEAKTEGIKAGEKAGNALVRAAESEAKTALLEKEAAAIRNETAQANERVEKLKAENIAWQKAMLPRYIGLIGIDGPPKAQEYFAGIDRFAGTPISIQVVAGDSEAQNLAIQVAQVLSMYGWLPKFVDEKRTNLLSQNIREGVQIYTRTSTEPYDASHPNKPEYVWSHAATALARALTMAGLGVGDSPISATGTFADPKDTFPGIPSLFPDFQGILLLVGSRPVTETLMWIESKQKRDGGQ